MTKSMTALLALLAVGPTGCGDGDDAADIAGTYNISLTNGPNGCGFPSWNENQTTQGVQLIVTQDPTDKNKATASVEGLAGGFLELTFGSRRFEGSAKGSNLDLTSTGRAGADGSCAFTQKARVTGKLEGDLLTGTISYSFTTTGEPACGVRNTCATTQSFNGTRPPKAMP
jgi:hypothetical protein